MKPTTIHIFVLKKLKPTTIYKLITIYKADGQKADHDLLSWREMPSRPRFTKLTGLKADHNLQSRTQLKADHNLQSRREKSRPQFPKLTRVPKPTTIYKADHNLQSWRDKKPTTMYKADEKY